MPNVPGDSVDILVIGAGLIGSSTVMHLSQWATKQGKTIGLLDADFAGKLSSSELNAGGARATWNQEINIRLSQDSIAFFREHAHAVGFHPSGYLWMFDSATWPAAQRRAAKLNKFNLDVRELSLAELQRHAPFLDKTEGIAGATFSPQDGLFNPNLLKTVFRDQAAAAGVTFFDGHRVQAVLRENGTFQVRCQVESPEDENSLAEFLVADKCELARQSREIKTKIIVNCAGAWASQLAQLIGYGSPTWAVRRQVSVFTCRDLDLRPYGMMVDTSGVYFHPEANNILAGWADPQEPKGRNLTYDGLAFFEEKIWAPLYERSSKFESLKHVTGWAGLYEMSPDHSGIIGKAPGQENVFEAHGFSGHGAMQSYAIGRALAELIHFGRYQTIDCSVLSAERFATGSLVDEGLLI